MSFERWFFCLLGLMTVGAVFLGCFSAGRDTSAVKLENPALGVDASLEARFATLEAKFDRFESRIGTFEAAIGDIGSVRAELSAIRSSIGSIGGGGDSVTAWIYAIGAAASGLLYPLVWRPIRRWNESRNGRHSGTIHDEPIPRARAP